MKEAIKVSVITVSIPPATRMLDSTVLWGVVIVVVEGGEGQELVVVAEGVACRAGGVVVEVNLQTVPVVLRAHREGLVLLHKRTRIALHTPIT